jgi:hypothetical protein
VAGISCSGTPEDPVGEELGEASLAVCDATPQSVALWGKQYGDVRAQRGRQVAMDPSGNVVATGRFDGVVDFGGGPFTNTGGEDAWVAKLDAAGNHLWSRAWGDSTALYTQGVAVGVDSAGGVLVTGNISGSANFGGGTLTSAGQDDIFVVKLDANGNHVWSKRYGDANIQYAQSITADPAGNVLVAGYFQGAVDFGTGVLTSAGNFDAILLKLNGATGATMWAKRVGTQTFQDTWDVASDASGNIHLAGNFQGSINLGGPTLTSPSNQDFDTYAAKFDTNGNHLWSLQGGGAGDGFMHNLAVDSAGNVALAGAFGGVLNMGAVSLTSAGDEDIFVVKVTPAGSVSWGKRYGDAGFQRAVAVTFDPAGNIGFTGRFFSTLDLGGGVMTSAGDADLFVAELDAAGNHLWSKRYGDLQYQGGYGIAADAFGDLYITGRFAGLLALESGSMTAGGQRDILIAKFRGVGCSVCAGAANGTPCDDGSACTTGDSCQAGQCTGAAVTCNDGNACTSETCVPASGCVFTNLTGPCNDGNACTTGETCQAGQCTGGVAVSCNDNNACTSETCNPATGCVYTNLSGACDDGNACTSGDTCQAGVCVGGVTMNCDDGNACTTDTCGAGGCVHTNNSSPCSDGNACTAGDVCSGGVCVPGAAVSCNDGNACTSDSCNPATGCVNSAIAGACDDGNVCTTGDSCQSGVCGGTAVSCNDGNPCTDDACSPISGCTFTNNTAACDDGDASTVNDHCQAGVCVGQSANDLDGDGVPDAIDNCPSVANPSQADSNGNGIGDACDPVCVSYRRGVLGTVVDSAVLSSRPNNTYGSSATVFVGATAGGTSYGLLKFDLSAIPANAVVTSSTITIAETTTAASTWRVHRVTSSWVEATVTWSSFASAFSPNIEASFAMPSPATKVSVSFDLAALTQAWLNGTYANYGVLFEQVGGTSTTLQMSESVTVNLRPKLDLCYTRPG